MTTLEFFLETRKNPNEDENLKNENLGILKNWLKNELDLPLDRDDDSRLLSFLRCCNFSIEKAKKKLRNYFTLKRNTPEFFSYQEYNIAEIKILTQKANILVLPKLTSCGNRITVAYFFNSSFDSSDFLNLIRLGFMISDIYLELDEEMVPGNILILDASVFHLGNLFKVSIPTFRKFIHFLQEALPFKLTEIHLIRPTLGLDLAMKIILPFCKEKIRKRFYVHSTLDSLYRWVPKNLLSKELGGSDLKMMDVMDVWIKILEEKNLLK